MPAYRAGLNVAIINAIWVTVTLVEIYAGFALGKWAERRFPHAKPTQWGKKVAGIAERRIGKGGKKFLLFSLGFLTFAPVVAFAAAWLDVSLAAILIFVLLGEFVWYVLEWGAALGVSATNSNLVTELTVILTLGILITLLSTRFRKKGGTIR